jgi:hypothetical protein
VFQIVAIPFDAFQALPTPQHRWLLTCFSRYVDKAGIAFPTLRQLARDARISLSSVSRYMTAMADLGVFQRERQPGGRYRYTLAEAYRPRWPGRPKPSVPALELRVPQAATQQVKPAKQIEKERFAGLLDDRQQWEARLRSWNRSGGRFWNPFWGPKPTEPGCFVPLVLLQAVMQSNS